MVIWVFFAEAFLGGNDKGGNLVFVAFLMKWNGRTKNLFF